MLDRVSDTDANCAHVGSKCAAPSPDHNSDPIADPLHTLWNDCSDEQSGIFGLPFSVDESSLVVIPVPWDAACSQGTGAANAPELILETSRYVELHDVALGNIYERKIAMTSVLPEISSLATEANSLLQTDPEPGTRLDPLCYRMNQLVDSQVSVQLAMGKRTALLGGDHSVSFGSIAAYQRVFPDIGILQIDAHADLRPSLDGITWSHASVMHHTMELLQPAALTQIGLRALCGIERAYLESNKQISVFTDYEMQFWLASGQSWLTICDRMIDTLPAELYLTLDIDGLDPGYCPNTGTPVPGGMTFNQVLLLLHRIVDSGRVIRGFDLVEVGGEQQDALIAAHLLYMLCGLVEHVEQ